VQLLLLMPMSARKAISVSLDCFPAATKLPVWPTIVVTMRVVISVDDESSGFTIKIIDFDVEQNVFTCLITGFDREIEHRCSPSLRERVLHPVEHDFRATLT
jgi:hypothetical protein